MALTNHVKLNQTQTRKGFAILAGFIILTYVGSQLRGPNWDFYWSKSQWPMH